MGELPSYRVAVRARKEPAGTYTYVITRIDDPNWAESTGESYSTPEAASEAGWSALDRIRAVKKLDRSSPFASVPSIPPHPPSSFSLLRTPDMTAYAPT